MKRSACLLSFLSLLAIACGDSKMNTDESDSNTGTATATMGSGIITTMTTPSTDPKTTEDDGTASASATMASATEPTGTATEPTGGATTFDPNDCGESVVMIPIVTPSVMLVLDKSGSMVSDPGGFWDHDADDADNDGVQDADMVSPATPKITRWKSLWSVVDLIVNNFNGSMNMGMVLFPSKAAKGDYSEVACVVNAAPEVPIGSMNAAAIIAAIPGADETTTIKGGTPATRGLKTALAELEKAPADQPKFMIFVTDGAANCQENAPDNTALFEQYDEDVVPLLEMAAAAGIKTYAVGIGLTTTVSGTAKDGNPDSVNSVEKMNAIAEAGGVPRPGDEKFFNTQNQGELQDALDMISMQILSCTLDLDPSPVYLKFVEVTVKEMYGNVQVTDCATESGWKYAPEDPMKPGVVRIELCGQACTDFQMTGMIDIQYRCPTSG